MPRQVVSLRQRLDEQALHPGLPPGLCPPAPAASTGKARGSQVPDTVFPLMSEPGTPEPGKQYVHILDVWQQVSKDLPWLSGGREALSLGLNFLRQSLASGSLEGEDPLLIRGAAGHEYSHPNSGD